MAKKPESFVNISNLKQFLLMYILKFLNSILLKCINPFTFKVIIDKCDPVTIYLIVLGSGLYTLFVFPV